MCPRLRHQAPPLLVLPVLLASICLSGCGSKPVHSIPATTIANWQIQVGTAITAPPTGMYILGDTETTGSEITGTFTNNMPCSPATSPYTGTTSSSGELTLHGTSDDATLLPPASQYAMTTGTLSGGGYLCQIVGGGPAVGIEIPPLNATYTGKLSASASSSGTATLTVSQGTPPNAGGQFPVTGTIQFTTTACSSTADLTGTINGTVVALTATGVTLSAYDNPANSTTTLPATLIFTTGACGTTPYTGTLTLQ